MLKQAAIIESTNAAPVIYDVNGNIVPDSGATVTVGGTTNLKITPNVTQTDENGNTVNITSGITYEASASGSTASVSVDQSGNITISGNSVGNCDITVNILYNGSVIGTQKVKLTVKDYESEIDWNTVGVDNRDNTRFTVVGWTGIGGEESYKDQARMTASANNCKGAFNNIIDNILTKCQASGNYNSNALETAARKTKELYNIMLDTLFNVSIRGGKKSESTQTVTYDGESYSAFTKTQHYQSTAEDYDSIIRSSSAEYNQLGLVVSVSTSDEDTYICQVNMTCVLAIFEKFYKQALG